MKVELVVGNSQKLPRYTVGFVMNEQAYYYENYTHDDRKLFVSTDPASANSFVFLEAIALKDFLLTIEGVSSVTIGDEWK